MPSGVGADIFSGEGQTGPDATCLIKSERLFVRLTGLDS